MSRASLPLLLLAATVTLTMLLAGVAEAQAQTPKGYFGTVVSKSDDGVLTLRTKNEDVEVPTTADTQAHLPQNIDATVADLAEGDVVALSLADDGTASKIALIPGKTRFRHLSGVVVRVSDSAVVIQPPGDASEPISLDLTPSTKIILKGGTTRLRSGVRVVVVAARDKDSGELVLAAREITVVPAAVVRRKVKEQRAEQRSNPSTVKGVFEGLDDQGNLIIDGVTVLVRQGTEVADGLVVGVRIEVEADLGNNGVLTAWRVARVQERVGVANVTRIRGTFDGTDDEGRWIVDGVALLIERNTDTDGEPEVGQRVAVLAVRRDDDTLIAREIENVRQAVARHIQSREVELRGVFRGVEEDGRWRVNGIAFVVDKETVLEGSPGVGSPVHVKAVRGPNGDLRAVAIRGIETDQSATTREVKISGRVEAVGEDGTIAVRGFRVLTGSLTEYSGEPSVGDVVTIKARLHRDGTLEAAFVETRTPEDQGSETGRRQSKVDIAGIVEKVNEDGSLVVNGIRISREGLVETRGDLVEGSSVRVVGVLQADGAVAADQLRGENAEAAAGRSEVRIEGRVGEIARDASGEPVGIVVNGTLVTLRKLSEVALRLRVGVEVVVSGVIEDGHFVAKRVQARPVARRDAVAEVNIGGPVAGITLDDNGRPTRLRVNGANVAITEDTKIEGELARGVIVKIAGVTRGDAVVARVIVAAPGRDMVRAEDGDASTLRRAELTGVVDAVFRNQSGQVRGLTVDGRSVEVSENTKTEGLIRQGLRVRIKGVLKRGVLVAEAIQGLPIERTVQVPVRIGSGDSGQTDRQQPRSR